MGFCSPHEFDFVAIVCCVDFFRPASEVQALLRLHFRFLPASASTSLLVEKRCPENHLNLSIQCQQGAKCKKHPRRSQAAFSYM